MSMIEADELTKTYRVAQKQEGVLGALRGLYRREYREVRAVDRISFRIEPGRKGRRPHEIADHDSQMPTLCSLRLPDPGALEMLSFAGVGLAGVGLGKRAPDRLEKSLPVAERDLELFEIGLGKLRHDVCVDGMLGK